MPTDNLTPEQQDFLMTPMERYNTESFEASDKTSDEDEEEILLCGYGGCTPKWLQKFHTAKWLLVMLGISAFVQSFVVNAIFPVDLSTLEKRFKLTSTHTGIISSWYDFAVLLVVFPCCHWGNQGHKGRWIGWGGFIMALGSLVCALPHWIVVDDMHLRHFDAKNESEFGQCTARDLSMEHAHCHEAPPISSYFNTAFILFLVGQTLHGVGSTPLFSIGTTYLDENVSQKASPVYLAIHAVLTSFGPIVGLFAGGTLLAFNENIDIGVDPTIKGYDDPRWVGAWWIGFVVSAVAALLVAIPILGFARELPEAKRHRSKDVNQVHASTKEPHAKAPTEVKALPKVIIKILRCPTFIACMLVGIFESIVINGFAAFIPKILETLLSTSPTFASYLSSVVILAAAVGVMIGGASIRHFKLQVGGMLKMIGICHIIALVFFMGLVFPCPQRQFVGINMGYNDVEVHRLQEFEVKNECNQDCDCRHEWSPVCDPEKNHMYYSACFAGCKNKNDKGDWTDCACISSNATHFGVQTPNPTLTNSYCKTDCGNKPYILMGFLFVTVVASFAAGIPIQQIMLRVVPFDQRTLALGINWTFLRLLGFIPGGILFGVIIDTACLEWDESCTRKTSCLVYDPVKLSWAITALAVVCKLLAILATTIGYMTYRPNDLDNGVSVQTTDSHGALHLVVNDDRTPHDSGVKSTTTQ